MVWREIKLRAVPWIGDFLSLKLDELNIKGMVMEEEASPYCLKLYIDPETDVDLTTHGLRKSLRQLEQQGLCVGAWELSVSDVEEVDWTIYWKSFYHPLRVGESLFIRPAWLSEPAKDGEVLIEINPGMAFGVGTHSTTVLCLEALERKVKRGTVVHDVGCGTGILSIAAVKLGADRVYGVDIDPKAVEASNDNAGLNNVSANTRFTEGEIDWLSQVEQADIMVANILAPVIRLIIPLSSTYLKAGGVFLISGITIEQSEEVEQLLNNNGYELQDKYFRDEWVLLEAVKL